MKKYIYQDGLKSERLVTRFLAEQDITWWKPFFSDPEVRKLFPDALFHDENPSATWISRQMQRYSDQTFGLQALIHRESGECIGQCGLLLQEVDGIQELEVGYHLLEKHRGRGYASEAARLFLDYAFAHGLSPSVISIIDINNTKSQRVAEKNGLKREKQTSWKGSDVFIYRTTSSTFFSSAASG